MMAEKKAGSAFVPIVVILTVLILVTAFVLTTVIPTGTPERGAGRIEQIETTRHPNASQPNFGRALGSVA